MKSTSLTLTLFHNRYVGLRYVKVACEGSECDPAATSFSWSAADCNASYCESCRNAADNTIITAFTGLITMLPQISTSKFRCCLE